ncbi:hypothetical protein EJ110_NYTH36764 [Nymphaea thermarum]|nr:hypothetical protein EJ110_NYTH36764 [Nymphaea thermarum]
MEREPQLTVHLAPPTTHMPRVRISFMGILSLYGVVSCGLCLNILDLDPSILKSERYIQRSGDGETEQEIQMERTMEGTSILEVAVLFFQSVMFHQSAVTTEECIVEMEKLVREDVGCAEPSFTRAADAMEEWVRV